MCGGRSQIEVRSLQVAFKSVAPTADTLQWHRECYEHCYGLQWSSEDEEQDAD